MTGRPKRGKKTVKGRLKWVRKEGKAAERHSGETKRHIKGRERETTCVPLSILSMRLRREGNTLTRKLETMAVPG